MNIPVGASLLLFNILAFAALYYKKDKRHHKMHRWQDTQRATYTQHAGGCGHDFWHDKPLLPPPPLPPSTTMAVGIRVAGPPDYTLTLQSAPNDIVRVESNTITVAGAAMGGSSGALHASNAFTGHGVGGNGQNLPHEHSKT